MTDTDSPATILLAPPSCGARSAAGSIADALAHLQTFGTGTRTAIAHLIDLHTMTPDLIAALDEIVAGVPGAIERAGFLLARIRSRGE